MERENREGKNSRIPEPNVIPESYAPNKIPKSEDGMIMSPHSRLFVRQVHVLEWISGCGKGAAVERFQIVQGIDTQHQIR